MCPDIETYAPLIEAGFGLGDVVGELRPPGPSAAGAARRPARRCRPTRCSAVATGAARRWRAVARRRPRCSTSPAPSRCAGGSGSATTTSSSSTSGPASPGSGGPSTPSTAPSSASSTYVANTWEFGLDRLLTGVALSDDSSAWLDRALPLDDVGSAQVDLVGRLTEYVDRLRDGDRPAHRHPSARPLAGGARRRRRVADRGVDRSTAGSRARCSASSAASAARRPASATSTCGCPTCARCCPTGWPADRRGPTSAPARSPSARWCRCGRCPTGWSACSASTTGCSRGRARSTATTCWPATR